MIYFDTETCGFHGPIVLIQWAEDDGPIHLHEVWHEPISKTMELIENIVASDVCGFNLSFDWFHICQFYTTLLLLPDNSILPDVPSYVKMESKARFGPCLKPKAA